tara:strand:- start:211046 stop:211234 length:189 start_codon:yes stop_codon:yes gene_type:complete
MAMRFGVMLSAPRRRYLEGVRLSLSCTSSEAGAAAESVLHEEAPSPQPPQPEPFGAKVFFTV